MTTSTTTRPTPADPLLALAGSGHGLWPEGADAFVDAARAEEPVGLGGKSGPDDDASGGPSDDELEALWTRIEDAAGETLRTARGLEKTHQVDGTGLWFFHADGRRIEQRSAKTEVLEAVALALSGRVRVVTDLTQFRNPSYLFALFRHLGL